MPHIQQLDSHIADLIAAGEVVERPASVVKELVENAIDAGAQALTVEIQNGGMALIRVTDDGCGISPDEAETAFLRHATSKIRTEYDLEAIGTLGFRGEALAAIAAVSRVEVLTRTEDAPLGVSLTLEGGVVTGREEAGCPLGTTMLVRDLFYNTPARLKFMKRDAAEGAAVFAAVQRIALSHPEVSFKFLRDGKQELLTPGDGQLKSAVYSVLGRDLALGFVAVSGSGEEMTVSGFCSLPACCRGTRGYQHFFVNGRYVKSRTMMAALEEAYANQKMVGKFPGCVLHLATKLNQVDVNVHPTKTEVKFASDKKVFDAVYYAVKSTLEGDKTRPQAVVTPAPSDTVTPNQLKMPQAVEAFSELPSSARSLHDFTAPRPAERSAGASPRPTWTPAPTHTPPAAPLGRKLAPAAEDGHACAAERETVPAAPSSLPAPTPAPEELPWRLAGEVLSTYIIVEQGDKVLFIDKHAAHERVNFDRLKTQDYRPMVQSLLTPAVFTPPAEEGAVLLQNLPLLAQFGFAAEDFGGGALVVREVPYDVDAGDIENTLLEIAAKLLATGRADPAAARDAVMHTVACKAAIKGGQKNGPEELVKVAAAVMRGEVKYCPHGRPVAIELTRGQLEKQFRRT
jgi:DNA mismatch repair protein MutL